MRRSIVISGMGAVTPLGVGVENYWTQLAAGVCGIDEISRIDSESLPVHRAGEVRDFHPRDFMSKPLTMDLELFGQYAYAAAEQAVSQSGLDTKSSRVGVVMGTALHGIDYLARMQQDCDRSGKTGDPKLMTKYMGNIVAAQFAIHHGIQGPSLTVGTACSSGGDAVTLATLLLESGRADAVVVMAGEAALCPISIYSLYKTRAVSPSGASRPFSVDRDGFVIGEGGGALLLETEEHALRRNAPVFARLLGCANNTDAYHPVSPNPEGNVAVECIRLALKDAGLVPEAIDYINAHGTATPKGDEAEALAIHKVFGDRPVSVSSSKGATGHMMAAGGITELIACVKAIESGVLPPNLGLAQPDESLALNLITAENQRQNISIAMSNAFGFGGQNSCLIVGRV